MFSATPVRRSAAQVRGVSPLLLAALSIMGCVERHETIQVQPDGRVDFTLVHRSDSLQDLYEGDAAPSLRGGWIVAEQVEQAPSGEETHAFTAEASVALGKKLPSNLADFADPDADRAMQFPTTLRIEKRGGATWYHFARTYEPRAWEQVEFSRRQMERDLQSVNGKPVGDWTPAERENVVRAYLGHDAFKRLSFARQAYLEVKQDERQDGWLAVQAALDETLRNQDIERLAGLLVSAGEPGGRGEEEQRQEALEAEIDRMEQSCLEAMQNTLRREAAFSGEQAASFLHHYQRARRFHEVTEDLGDDTFQITVEMPGRIVASNAPSTSDRQATWNFRGEDVRDRRLELLVSSVVDQ